MRDSALGAPIAAGASRATTVLVGRIEWDAETNGEVPIIVIDGKPFTWEQVGRMLTTFEGFTLDARIEDTIQVIGDRIERTPRQACDCRAIEASSRPGNDSRTAWRSNGAGRPGAIEPSFSPTLGSLRSRPRMCGQPGLSVSV
jgi:hypothetical protein